MIVFLKVMAPGESGSPESVQNDHILFEDQALHKSLALEFHFVFTALFRSSMIHALVSCPNDFMTITVLIFIHASACKYTLNCKGKVVLLNRV